MADLAERARFDRVDHHPHPLMQSLCGMDRFRRAIATLGAMLGRAVFGGIGDAAREERLAPAREILRFGPARPDRNRRTVAMDLGERDTETGSTSHKHPP